MRGSRSPRRGAALAAALVLALGACGTSAGDDAVRDTTTTTATTTAPPATSSTDPADYPTTTPTLTPDGDEPDTTLAPMPEDPAQVLQFRPVLGEQPCSAVTPDDPDSTETTIPEGPELVPDADGERCYGLGPVGADGADLTGATVATDESTGSWIVTVEARPESVDELNALLNSCNLGGLTCPASGGSPGRAAIVYRGAVISAPVVQALDLAAEPFQISGDFSEQEARALAAALNG